MSEILFSIIMPTYNSERTIAKALRSIREQDIPQECLEILVIDGGSKDKTVAIAKEYGAVVLENPHKVPEAAKCIGVVYAHGQWIIEQDSDEVFADKSQLRKRKEFLERNPQIFCLLADRLEPGKSSGISNAYLNYIGDPFTYIVHKNCFGSVVLNNKKYIWEKTTLGNIYRYKRQDILPIGDGGTSMINIWKLKELAGEKYCDESIVCSMATFLIQQTEYAGCIPGDTVKHYSRATLRQYLRKQKFKVYNNLNHSAQSGFGTREKGNKTLSRRKFLFVLYCASIVVPLIDSFKLSWRFRDKSMLLHFVYVYYIALRIVIEIVKKCFHIKKESYHYG